MSDDGTDDKPDFLAPDEDVLDDTAPETPAPAPAAAAPASARRGPRVVGRESRAALP